MPTSHVTILLARVMGSCLDSFEFTFCSAASCPKLHCFWKFAGTRAHHQGLRWLKPCQFQRNVYWHCEFDKHRPAAQFQLLTVCSSLTRGRKANESCLTNLQVANMEVLWLKNIYCIIKAWSETSKKYIKLVGGRCFPPKEHSNLPRCNAVRSLLVGFFAEVADQKELI